jgi:hypothetical protein
MLDDIVGHSKTLGKAHVVHVTPKHLGPQLLGAKAAPFSIAALAAMLDGHAVLEVCLIIFSVILMACCKLERSVRMARSETGWGLHW